MTIHANERSRLVGNSSGGHTRPAVTARWGVRRSEVILPSPGSLAAVLVMGLFALSLSAAGLGFQITRILRRKK